MDSDKLLSNDFKSTNRTDKQGLKHSAVQTWNIENAAITNAKIKDLSWDKGQGGTLTLGGSSNGNGLLSLKNSSGSEIVKLDNTGVTVNNGNITIKNSNSSTIIDATGLVSNSNFLNNSASYTGAGDLTLVTTTNTLSGWSDIDASLSLSLTLTRTTNIYIFFTGMFGALRNVADGTSTNIDGYVRVNIDGSQSGPVITFWSLSGTTYNVPVRTYSTSQIVSLGAGSHTIKMQWQIYSGYIILPGTSTITGVAAGTPVAQLGYIQLGS